MHRSDQPSQLTCLGICHSCVVESTMPSSLFRFLLLVLDISSVYHRPKGRKVPELSEPTDIKIPQSIDVAAQGRARPSARRWVLGHSCRGEVG